MSLNTSNNAVSFRDSQEHRKPPARQSGDSLFECCLPVANNRLPSETLTYLSPHINYFLTINIVPEMVFVSQKSCYNNFLTCD